MQANMIEQLNNRGMVVPQCTTTADPRRRPDILRFGFAQKVFRLKHSICEAADNHVEESMQLIQLKISRPARLRALR
jgi:hypothetical protein